MPDAALPPAMAAFFEAHNAGRTENFGGLFAADAVVADEEHEHRGPAIKAWLDDAIAKYRPLHAEAADLTESGGHFIGHGPGERGFPGSPAALRYDFTLRDGKIAALDIGV